ncbi:MAG: hypothetical protein EPN70_24745 [Paraburkholderia sp.]|uniref:hypothetical protein n=1 Tax=Paraburkholderia sp. TaxID=1926495 RepID=UPI001219717B|nr:hypothetical protein [Paraburkholderia sp.]TAL99635.1 MAG: hypothetical protein EPN70_24745 [Paraburkholderia sp.]TAM28414.1 MAG: hypothetical protein EPN59_15395 [Paraburkholderia sp.]
MNKKTVLHVLLLLPALSAFGAECTPKPAATLAHMSPSRLTHYYVKLGKIKNAWLENSGMDHPKWSQQAQMCDKEADRVQQVAKHKGMDLFELETSGRYTGLLGTDTVANAPDPVKPAAPVKKAHARVSKKYAARTR